MAVEDAAMISNILAAVEAHSNGSLSGKLWGREYQARRESRVRAFMKKAQSMDKFSDQNNGWTDDPQEFKSWAVWALLPAMSWTGSEKDVQGWSYDVDEDVIRVRDLFESQPEIPPSEEI